MAFKIQILIPEKHSWIFKTIRHSVDLLPEKNVNKYDKGEHKKNGKNHFGSYWV
jgi:hypothetical protein